MRQTLSITRKELKGYFGSPMALIFIGAFLAATLFAFFWIDTFFARGIADVRPLFSWMPVLMIFLVAALTMRQWSEEQRSGTLEVLLTLPVSHMQLVVGKFLAVVALVGVALALTLSLPITVALLGNLDWGPVVGGYLASILLAAAYAAIGLFVSSRTDNQIVALILTVLVCGVLYVVGSSGVVDFFGDTAAEVLRAIGAGSRFESIERGVIDLRDLVYYLSLTGLFLTLNVLSLDSKGWSKGEQTQRYRRGIQVMAALITANLLVLNVWLSPLHGLRLDMTSQREYSLSEATRDILDNLAEPLLIRGYFSERTHPLLAPLVPRIEDMLREYEIASRGMIELEIIDPAEEPEMEAEANQTYGIQPMPFQVADRYETSVINSYFHLLIRYGDQHVVLSFEDLIEVQPSRSGDVEVGLRNLEYDLTSAIKKVVYGFQSVDAVLAAMEEPVQLTVFITPDSLPESLAEAPATIETVASEIAADSNGKFAYELIDPDAPDSPINRDQLLDRLGLQPIAVSLFSNQTYYMHMVLQIGEEAQLLYPTGTLSEADVRTTIESALKRASTGFLKVVGIWTPPAEPTQDMFGQVQQPISSWRTVQQYLRENYEVRTVDLAQEVAADVDVVVLIGPQGMSDLERFHIDQYLMRGGAVVVAAGNYTIMPDQMTGGLGLQPLDGNLSEMLAHYGIEVEESLVMDPQNERFPVPVVRDVGGFQVQEIQAIDYPFFVDVRPDGMDPENPIVSNLPAVTLNWASPLVVDETANAERQVDVLLQSSEDSWLRTDTNIQPNFDQYPDLGFAREGEGQSYPLAVAVQGILESYFVGKPIPTPEPLQGETTAEEPLPSEPAAGVIEASPESARLVVVGSAEFVDDLVFNISSNLSRDRYLNTLQFVQNVVDWSVEDLELLAIRSRGTTSRLLSPTVESQQSFWEGANYVVALLALVAIGAVWNVRRRNEEPMELIPPVEGGKPTAAMEEEE
jgi:ABC-2 type transport system permease protein